MSVITAIEAQKKKKDRANIYLDGRFFCGMQSVTLLSSGLGVGSVVDENELLELQQKSEADVAFQKALNQISVRMRSKKEIEHYLEEKGFLSPVVEATIKKLEEYGYVDDVLFAKEFVSCYPKLGNLAIKQKLRQKGIAEDVVCAVVVSSEEEQIQKATNLAEKFVKLHPNSKNLREKLVRHLVTKGFGFDVANTIAKKVTTIEGDEYYEN